ncbi:MAG: hypothetical protein ACK4Q5_09020, partial [Saprospiraceae bacterium]
DAAFMATMIPKGLGAAVLASVPAQQGMPGGEVIQSVVFAIILCSTLFATLLTFLVDRTALAAVYAFVFRLLGLGRGAAGEAVLPEIPATDSPRPTSPRPKRRRNRRRPKADLG